MTDDPDEDEAQALLKVAHAVVALATDRARAISPDHVAASSLAILETAHASMLAAAVLALRGLEAPAELGDALDMARNHLRHFAECFVENGVKMIESGELPPEMLVPAVRP